MIWEVWLECREWIELEMKRCIGELAGIEREIVSRADQRVLRWFWAFGKTGWVPHGQKDVDGGSQWRTGTRETEVRLDGWCEGGHRQHWNDGGGSATMLKRSERVESPGTYVAEWVSRGHFDFSLFFRTALPCFGGYHLERRGMPLHDEVEINCKRGATTENQGSGVKYMC